MTTQSVLTILANISRHVHLTDEEQQHLFSLLDEQVIRKKDSLLLMDAPCTSIYYVCTGALRAYHQGPDGKESTIMFAIADLWITDMFAFINQKPAMMTIKTIENSTVLALSKKNMDSLFQEVPRFERFFRILMQNAYVREQLRLIQNLSLPAEERYRNFLTKYPTIARRVTQKQIASYLGVTPEFLSVMRRRTG